MPKTSPPKKQKRTAPLHKPPGFAGFTAAAFDYLAALSQNNEREWFQDHKKTYHKAVRDPFIAFMEALSFRLEGSGLDLRGGKQTVFRIHRDVRFSKDKTPYKTHTGGVLSYGGNKKDQRGIVYIQFGVDGGFMAAGFYQPESDVLTAIREAIAQNPEDALKLCQSLEKIGLPVQATATLKRMPRGFEAYKEHEISELLRMKGYIMRRDLSPELWQSPEIVEAVAQFAHDAYPWLAFGREAIATLDTI